MPLSSDAAGSIYQVVPSRPVLRYLKKLQDRVLKQRFADLIYDVIAADPYSGDRKNADLTGVWTMGFRYQKTTYRVAYLIVDEDKIVPILLAGTHEGFYEQLKQYIS
ncbi:MAG: type II toxin-antitoxin system RelE/ParE family toxin [Propionibacteriaceae bacterium]|jgi:mRNA-degrading endonuclease RelE of RelBE toxin-antitoxin system|nr:type II toxin-antitoxin system RelE/ParE family toxin [Propionibacteriaceae bacterium]